MVNFELALNIPLLADPEGTILLLHDNLSEAFEGSLRTLRDMVREGTPVFRGTLRASISYELKELSSPAAFLGRVFSYAGPSRQVDYVLPVEFGTRPHWPNVMAISAWVGTKPLVYPYGEKAELYPQFVSRWVSFLVARKISKVGTPGHFMFKRAKEEFANQGILQKNIQEAADSFLRKATT